jgi:hypothetical protein
MESGLPGVGQTAANSSYRSPSEAPYGSSARAWWATMTAVPRTAKAAAAGTSVPALSGFGLFWRQVSRAFDASSTRSLGREDNGQHGSVDRGLSRLMSNPAVIIHRCKRSRTAVRMGFQFHADFHLSEADGLSRLHATLRLDADPIHVRAIARTALANDQLTSIHKQLAMLSRNRIVQNHDVIPSVPTHSMMSVIKAA